MERKKEGRGDEGTERRNKKEGGREGWREKKREGVKSVKPMARKVASPPLVHRRRSLVNFGGKIFLPENYESKIKKNSQFLCDICPIN